jgi:gamma-glutamyltranspeptidase/glutathione hydrolase
MALGVLDRAAETDSVRVAHLGVEAIEAAFAFRDEVAVPGAASRLLSTELEVDRLRARRLGGPRGYAHTTAVASADSEGTVVSMLVSVFDDFGSAGLVGPGGFFLNNRMTGFSPNPGSPNAAAPGRRPVHTLSPALVEEPGSVMALATPGADGQVQFLVQLVDGLLRGGASLPEVLGRPRWRSVDGGLALEGGFDDAVADGLQKLGHELLRLPAGHELFGAAVAAGVDNRAGSLFAAADPRREAWAGGC